VNDLESLELDLLTRLSVLYERHELYPNEVTERQVDELDRRLDGVREELTSLRAASPGRRD
jgi:hypothetical protein